MHAKNLLELLLVFFYLLKNQKNNKTLFNIYKNRLDTIPGIKLIEPAGVTQSNYQYIVCEIDESLFGLSRDALIKVLKAENIIARRYFYPGAHRSVDYISMFQNNTASLPVTERLCETCIQFPVGALVDENVVGAISDIVENSHLNAKMLNAFLIGK